MTMKITDFITGKVTYDKFGGSYFWINDPKIGAKMLADTRIRGFGEIKNLCRSLDGEVDLDKAAKFQDEVGDFIAEAINEKIERLKNK